VSDNPCIYILYKCKRLGEIPPEILYDVTDKIQEYYASIGIRGRIFVELMVYNEALVQMGDNSHRAKYFSATSRDKYSSPFYEPLTRRLPGLPMREYKSYEDWQLEHPKNKTLSLIRNRTMYNG